MEASEISSGITSGRRPPGTHPKTPEASILEVRFLAIRVFKGGLGGGGETTLSWHVHATETQEPNTARDDWRGAVQNHRNNRGQNAKR